MGEVELKVVLVEEGGAAPQPVPQPRTAPTPQPGAPLPAPPAPPVPPRAPQRPQPPQQRAPAPTEQPEGRQGEPAARAEASRDKADLVRLLRGFAQQTGMTAVVPGLQALDRLAAVLERILAVPERLRAATQPIPAPPATQSPRQRTAQERQGQQPPAPQSRQGHRQPPRPPQPPQAPQQRAPGPPRPPQPPVPPVPPRAPQPPAPPAPPQPPRRPQPPQPPARAAGGAAQVGSGAAAGTSLARLGGALARISGPAIAVTAALGAVAYTAYRVDRGLRNLALTLEDLSPAVASAQAQGEMRAELARLDRAQTIGPQVAQLTAARHRLSEQMYHVQTRIFDLMLKASPLLEAAMDSLTVLVAGTETMVASLNRVYTALTLNPKDDEPAQKELEEAVERLSEALKELARNGAPDPFARDPILEELLRAPIDNPPAQPPPAPGGRP